MSRVELTFASNLAAPPKQVWSWITSVRGISRELAPILRMTIPRGITELADAEVELGQPLFRSRVLLFGVLPIDRSDLTLLGLEPGESLLEQSPMLGMRLWRHERTLEASGEGTLLTDRLTFEPRLVTFATRWFVRALFHHRHQVLRRHFGSRPPGGS